MKELTLKQAAEDCRGTLTPEQAEGMITGVQIDSRRVKPGDLFVAIKGEKSDGHDFIGMAASLGASAALVQRPVKAAIPTILVPDTIKAYGDLAAARRERMGMTVIGITGSVGKTTTKEMTACMLERTYRTARTEGNHNNNIGLPMTILDMPDDTETAVLELGMNHFGEMARLTSIAKPDIAVITNIGTMHIEHLGSREGILQAKLEIFRGVPKNGVGVFNGDEPLLWNVRADGGHKKYYFGIENHACDVFATDIQELEDGMRFVVSGFGHRFELFVPVLGRHTVYNALAAVTAALLLKIPPETIQAQISGFQNTGMRQKIYERDGFTIIEDCYNAGPESTEAALDILAGSARGQGPLHRRPRRYARARQPLGCGALPHRPHRRGEGRHALHLRHEFRAHGLRRDHRRHEAEIRRAFRHARGPGAHAQDACPARRRDLVQGQPRHADGKGPVAVFEGRRVVTARPVVYKRESRRDPEWMQCFLLFSARRWSRFC